MNQSLLNHYSIMDITTATEISKRIKQVFDALEVNPNEVAKKLNTHHSTVYKMLEGESMPNLKTILGLIAVYPHINESFLLRGNGSPLKNSTPVSDGQYSDVPLYSLESDPREARRISVVKPADIDISDCTVFEITDNAMRPQLHTGMKVLGKPVENKDWPYVSGVVAVAYGPELTVRRVYENELSIRDILVLTSDSELSGKVYVKRTDIHRIFKIVQIISGTVE